MPLEDRSLEAGEHCWVFFGTRQFIAASVTDGAQLRLVAAAEAAHEQMDAEPDALHPRHADLILGEQSRSGFAGQHRLRFARRRRRDIREGDCVHGTA